MRNEFSELLNWFYICQDVTSGERGGGPSSQVPGPRSQVLGPRVQDLASPDLGPGRPSLRPSVLGSQALQ